MEAGFGPAGESAAGGGGAVLAARGALRPENAKTATTITTINATTPAGT
jgi:hypothetical protein